MGLSVAKEQRELLLKSIVELMARAGDGEGAIKRAFEEGLLASQAACASRHRQLRDASYSQNGDVSADILRIWHRDGRYLKEDDGTPRPLPLSKGKDSVHSLIRELNPKANASEVMKFMLAANLVRKCANGRYLPTEEAGAIVRDDLFVVEHLTRSIIRLLSTVHRNTFGGQASRPLVERYAYVSDLSTSECEAFAEFTKSQGLSYLQAVDDWMEQRRVRRASKSKRSREPGVVAGVQIVAYLGDGHGAGGRMLGEGKSSRGSEGTDASLTRVSSKKVSRPPAKPS